jgi:hypothetical protein
MILLICFLGGKVLFVKKCEDSLGGGMKKSLFLLMLGAGCVLTATDRVAQVVSPQVLHVSEQSTCGTGQLLLLEALKQGKLGDFEQLLGAPGVDINHDYGNSATLLIKACVQPIDGDNNKDFIKLLVDRGADLCLQHEIWTKELGLGLAVASGSLPLLKALFDQNSKLKDFYFGSLGKELSFFDVAIIYDAPLQVLQFLLDRGVSLALGRPLHTAIKCKNLPAARLLLERSNAENQLNIDKMSCHKVRRTPLHYAIQHKDAAMVALLMRYRPNLAQQDGRGYTPHGLALALGLSDIAHLLTQPAVLPHEESPAAKVPGALKAAALKVKGLVSWLMHR